MRTPIYTGLLQSDLDFAGFKPLNADLSDYELGDGGGSSGPNVLISVNVKAPPYNAVGDGVTDDTAAIQGAIDDVTTSDNGGVIFFPDGIYLCNGAFDATTNSILKFPFNAVGLAPKTVVLQGLTPAAPYGGTYGTAAIIKTTRTDGAGTTPALLGAYTPVGYPSDDLTGFYFNHVNVNIKNLNFKVPDNPTVSGIRLDTCTMACIEDVDISCGNSEPTHAGTVGLWMPNGGNHGRSYARNVQISGFDIGLMFSEHFIGHNVIIVICKTAVGLITGYQPAELNFQTYWCPRHVANYGVHLPVKFVGRLEDGDPSVAPSWQLVQYHVDDSANTILGMMDYIRVREPERFHDDIILNGAGNLQLRNLHSSSYNWVKIGTDARLVAVSGGAKLEARNTGTGTWVEAARWTNP